jgi:hypothetical protein
MFLYLLESTKLDKNQAKNLVFELFWVKDSRFGGFKAVGAL